MNHDHTMTGKQVGDISVRSALLIKLLAQVINNGDAYQIHQILYQVDTGLQELTHRVPTYDLSTEKPKKQLRHLKCTRCNHQWIGAYCSTVPPLDERKQCPKCGSRIGVYPLCVPVNPP